MPDPGYLQFPFFRFVDHLKIGHHLRYFIALPLVFGKRLIPEKSHFYISKESRFGELGVQKGVFESPTRVMMSDRLGLRIQAGAQ